MKRLSYLILTALLVPSLAAYSQDAEPVYEMVETMPEFPGGQQALFRYIAEHILYPQDALAQGIEGRPVCQFVVNKDSTLSDIKLVRSCGTSSLDDEAIRVISEMPKWNPGKQQGQIVRTRFVLPVPFRISPAVKANIGEIHEEADIMPEFPGGAAALSNFLRENVTWPEIARKNDITGTAVCSFVVNKMGEITNPQILRSAGDPSLDKEALRVLGIMPNWTIGKKDGQPVRVFSKLRISVPYQDEKAKSDSDEKTFIVVENMPQFPGGQPALLNYLKENVHYPEAARKARIQGKTICQFIVDKDGSIVNVEVAQSSGNDLLDQEALRVIRKMPRWKPGSLKGKPVRVKYTIPINFSLK